MKLKSFLKENIKAILIVGVLVIVLFVVLTFTSVDENYQNFEGSTFSVNDYGTKALYLTFEEYFGRRDIAVDRYLKYGRFIGENTLVIGMISDGSVLMQPHELNAVFNNLYKNDTYILLDMSDNGIAEKMIAMYNENDYEVFSADTSIYGTDVKQMHFLKDGKESGKLYICNGMTSFYNNDIKKSDEDAIKLILFAEDLCGTEKLSRIYFDEFYNGIESSSVPDILGTGLMLALCQFALAALLFVWRSALRFEAPVNVSAIDKRNEIENVDALAKLYRRTGSANIGFIVYMDLLIEDIAVSMGMGRGCINKKDVIETAMRDKNMISIGVTDLLNVYSNIDKIKISNKELSYYISKIESIRKEL